MKYLIPLMIMVLTTSCLKLNGTFNAKKSLTLYHKPVFGKKRKKIVPAGKYKASSFKFIGKQKVKLVLRKSGKKIELRMKLPKGTKLPQTRGKISLKSRKSGQPYDIKGSINTKYSRSKTTSANERCTYTRSEYRCHRVCSKDNIKVGKKKGPGRGGRGGGRGGNCQRVCEYVPVAYTGTQDVSYHYSYTDKFLKLNLTKPSNGSKVASFNGKSHDSSKVYEYQGPCY